MARAAPTLQGHKRNDANTGQHTNNATLVATGQPHQGMPAAMALRQLGGVPNRQIDKSVA